VGVPTKTAQEESRKTKTAKKTKCACGAKPSMGVQEGQKTPSATKKKNIGKENLKAPSKRSNSKRL